MKGGGGREVEEGRWREGVFHDKGALRCYT